MFVLITRCLGDLFLTHFTLGYENNKNKKKPLNMIFILTECARMRGLFFRRCHVFGGACCSHSCLFLSSCESIQS